MIFLAILYFVFGFIVISLTHRYYNEMEPFEFLLFTCMWPIVSAMIILIILSEIFRGYLEWIQK
jgi:hypothetical protein